MNKLAVLTLILVMLGGLAACQFQATPTTPPLPTATIPANTAVPPVPTARPTQTPVPPLNSPNGPPLRSIEMFNADDGYGLVYNALLLTHTGGQEWYSIPMPEGQVNEATTVFYVNATTFYLVVPAPDGQSGQLYYTADGGGTWRITAVPFLQGHLTFIDSVGYFMETTRTASDSMNAAIFASLDGGLTWIKLFPGEDQAAANSLPAAGIKTGFAFISIDRGWIGVAQQAQKVILYKTETTANSWALQEVPAPKNISSLITSTFPPILFAGNHDEGLLPVDFVSMDTKARNRVFYFTNDGGLTWAPGESVIDGDVYSFIDPRTGWTWGKRGLFFTNNAAQTWQLLPVAFGRTEHAISLKFIDQTAGWLLTADAKNRVRIYNTQDGGNTWTAINP